MKKLILLFFWVMSLNQMYAQNNNGKISIVFTLIMEESKSHNVFPNTNPSIHKLFLIRGQDSIECEYNFPFLSVDSVAFNKMLSIANDDFYLSFLYSYWKKKKQIIYKIILPLKFLENYKKTHIIVIQHNRKGSFQMTQKCDGTLFLKKLYVRKIME
jgi:hypothetical protein